MRIHNLYEDELGQSHFRDIEVEWISEGRGGKLSERLPATGIIFRQVQPDYELDWHPAPRRQYIINLDAGVEITASDGEARIIDAGEVILVEDISGDGHMSKAINSQIRHCIFVPVEWERFSPSSAGKTVCSIFIFGAEQDISLCLKTEQA